MEHLLPTGRGGKILAVGLTLGLIVIAWLGVASPLIGWYGARADLLARQRAMEARMAGLAATLPALRAQAGAGSRDARALPAALLSGSSDAVAGADLQQRMQAMAAQAGIDLRSVETLPTVVAGADRRIGLRLSFDGSWPKLVQFLALIEKATPRMLVDDLQLHASPVLQHPDGVPLSASLTILAFRAG